MWCPIAYRPIPPCVLCYNENSMSTDAIHYRALLTDDVPALQTLLKRCYGDSYFDALYFDADALRDAIAKKQLRSCIALNASGDIVAHLGMRHAEGSLTSDSSLAIVDPKYRAKGLLVETGIRLCQTCLEMGLCGIYGTAVTVHPYTQKANLRSNAGITGIYLNYIPSGTRFLEVDNAQSDTPTPAVLMLTPLSPPPRRSCYIPQHYAGHIRAAFDHCNMQRDVLTHEPPLATHSKIRLIHKARQRVCYFWVDTPGCDLAEYITQHMARLKPEPINAFYIHLALDQAGLDACIAQLNRAGFFYAGVLVESSQRDWLILQCITGPEPDWEAVQLVGEHTNQLMRFIRDDRKAITAAR